MRLFKARRPVVGCLLKPGHLTWWLSACVALAAIARAQASIIVADSVADWGVSSAQGYNGWYYGYYNGTSAFPYTNNPAGDDFHLMTQFNPTGTDNEWWHQYGSGGYWTMVGQGNTHPNGTQAQHDGRLNVLEYSVRRWVSSVTGPIEITGHISMGGGTQGNNGISGHILIGGTDIYDQRVLSGNQTGFDFDLKVNVVAGQTIDFAVDPGPLTALNNYNDLFDTTKFTAQISTVSEMVPEPATCALATIGAVMLLALHRPRRMD